MSLQVSSKLRLNEDMSYKSIFKENLFLGKVFLVTGGGSGIGRCTANELSALGAKVVISGRNQEKLEKAAAEIKNCDWVVCDIREEDQVKNLIATCLKRHGRIDGVVNNAGGQFPSTLEKLSKNGWEAVVRNNLTGTFLVSREALNQYFKDHGGVIVNVVADFRNGMPFMGHTGAARAGVDNFTKTASVEWAKYKVRINSVAPGIVESTGLSNYDPAFMESVRKNAHKIPLKRFASESEISAAIVFLLSPAACYITGALIPVDGGSSLRGHTAPLEEYGPGTSFEG
jgi:citronellol/citronellal dehydrogenase